MANSTSTFRAIYSFGAGVTHTKSYPIAASEDWSVGSVVAWNSSGALLDPTSDAADVLGISLETVVSGATQGPITDLCAVHPFQYDVVYAVKNAATLSDSPVALDIGSIHDLDLASTVWGLLIDTASTGSTPQFRVVGIDTIRDEWHVVIAPLEVTDVFQWIDAAV